MAEGLLRALAGQRFEAFSAGTHPQGLHPRAIEAMDELGIDIRSQTSDHVDSYLGAGIDAVITVCDRAGANCPVFPERTRVTHWSFDDPVAAEGTEAERRAVFRRVRDEIGAALRAWVASGGAT